MSGSTRPSIGLVVIAHQLNEDNAVFTPVQNFLDLFSETSESITIFGPKQTSIRDERAHLHRMDRYDRPTLIREIVYHFYLQLRLAHALIKSRNELDVVFFHLGGTVLLMPLLISRLFGLNPIIIVTGTVKASHVEQHELTATTRVISPVIYVLENISSRLASRVVFFSESMNSQFRPIDDDHTNVANLNYTATDEFNRIPEKKWW